MSLIPKVIHYCWFGGNEMPEIIKKCIESWNEFLPEYKKVLWNEDNFDINSNRFVREAYETKKYAFVTDYVRLYALYYYGGIYMDSDVEVIKNIDKFLEHPAFSGFESRDFIPTGIMGSVEHHPWIGRLLEYYNDRPFCFSNGHLDMTPNVSIITKISQEEYGLNLGDMFQILTDDVYIYPHDYFCPLYWSTKQGVITENTHTIHHFAGSWNKI